MVGEREIKIGEIMTNGPETNPGVDAGAERGHEAEPSELEKVYLSEVKIAESRLLEALAVDLRNRGNDPEETAKMYSEKGEVPLTLAFLELTKLSIPEKSQILALAYSNSSRKANVQSADYSAIGNTKLKDHYNREAALFREKAQMLKG